jgi:hypothetical protein
MMTALGAARNILGAHHDLWAINTEPDYQEEKKAVTSDELPRPAYAEPLRVSANATPTIAKRASSGDAAAGQDMSR